MGDSDAEQKPGKRKLNGGRLKYERGIRYSDLPAPARHLALTLATWADIETGIIPDRFQPAKETLEQATGLSRGAVFKHLNTLDDAGWISREVGGGRNRRTRFTLRIPPGAKTGHEVTPFEEGNGSPGDLYPEETGHVVTETGHLVNVNGSPGDPKSPSVPQESLSSEPPAPTAPRSSERETFFRTINDDTAKVAAAWAAARSGRRNPGAEAEVAASARSFIAVGWTIPDLIELAEDMARTNSTYTDLAVHEKHWKIRATGPARLPAWCTRCGAGNPAAQTNARFRTSDGTAHGTKCTRCHPDTIKDTAA